MQVEILRKTKKSESGCGQNNQLCAAELKIPFKFMYFLWSTFFHSMIIQFSHIFPTAGYGNLLVFLPESILYLFFCLLGS